MKTGTKINVLKRAILWFRLSDPTDLGCIVTLDRNIEGEVLSVYPNGTPNKIELANQIIVKSGTH